MAASTLIALSEWKYYVLSFLPWLQTVCLAVFIVAALFIGNERDIGACSHLRLARS